MARADATEFKLHVYAVYKTRLVRKRVSKDEKENERQKLKKKKHLKLIIFQTVRI